MEKLKLHTPNMTETNIEKLAKLFPDCVTEVADGDKLVRAIDFDQLRQELSEHIVEGPRERFQLTWPGKREALLTANLPIAKTLRPLREESVDFDHTGNLFIEGDNLDVLKTFQETYLNKIKFVFIDPPYNTGNDYVYDDDFSEDAVEYFVRSNQTDEIGNRLVVNSEANGRFHSDWLSMMYPRLRLTRNLMSEDGVIFVSIDDGEVHNLKKVMDEVFGEKNFVANIIWQKKFARANDATYFSTMHDHILCYAKNSKLSNDGIGWELNLLPRGEATPEGYANPDDDPRGVWTSVVLSAKSGSDRLKYEIVTPAGRKVRPPDGRYWGVSEEKFADLIADNRIWFGKNGEGIPRLKTFLSEVQSGLRPNTIWFHQDVGHNQEGRQEVKKLFDDKAFFDSPKPVRLLRTILEITSKEPDFIALDFFAGSATTAHAVMAQNASDGGRRRFIMVQLPEPADEKSEAFKAGYRTLADIAKERIRRAGKKIREENPDAKDLDIGFRVLKIDSSNMRDVYYAPDQVNKDDLLAQVDNIREGRTAEDLLFQVLLDWGVDLSLSITKEMIADKAVYFVDETALVACFEQGVTEELVKKIAARHPLRTVFRDNGFETDSVKINVEQIFKLLSPVTEVKSI